MDPLAAAVVQTSMNWKIVLLFLFYVIRDAFSQNTSIVLILDRRPLILEGLYPDLIADNWKSLANSVIESLSLHDTVTNNHVRICLWDNRPSYKPKNSCGMVNKEIFSTDISEFEKKMTGNYEPDQAYKAGPIVISTLHVISVLLTH